MSSQPGRSRLAIWGNDIPLGAAVSLFMAPILAVAAVPDPAQRPQARQRGLRHDRRQPQTAGGAPAAPSRYGSIARGRKRTLYWSYFFLVLFVIFFLTPPLYMLITSLKSSAEIGAVTNPWWVYHPTLENYTDAADRNRSS